jgi:hypothetical protein
MKWLIVLVLVLGGLFYYPQLNESTSTACAATEKRFAWSAFEPKDGGAMLGALLASGVSNGALAGVFVKSHYPNLPVAVGCSVVYYQIMVDPDLSKRILAGR